MLRIMFGAKKKIPAATGIIGGQCPDSSMSVEV
jgi:hypothetical protein